MRGSRGELGGGRGEPGKRLGPAFCSPDVWERARAGNGRAVGRGTPRTWVGASGREGWLSAAGRLCVLAKWEVMLLTQSWSRYWGAWAGAR